MSFLIAKTETSTLRKLLRSPTAIAFFMTHLCVLAVFWTGVTKASIVICLSLYLLHGFAVTGGYHRYFSHKSFTTSRVFQFILACLAETAAEGGVLWWSDRHRRHHLYSDTEYDVHSPRQHGFWFAHIGWMFDTKEKNRRYTMVSDLAAYPELVWLDKHDLFPSVVLAACIFLAAGPSGFVVGFCLSRVLVWHVTATVNSLCHQFGSQRYNTGDDSRNNGWLSLLTMGESWHNNHHYYASSARQGFFWWEIDLTYYILKLLSVFGIIWDLKVPSAAIIQGAKQVTPNVRSRSRKLIVATEANLLQIATSLSEFTEELKQAAQNKLPSHYQLESKAAQLLESLNRSSLSLKKLPPKLYAIMKYDMQQAIVSLQALINALNSSMQENINAAVAKLENASMQLQDLICE